MSYEYNAANGRFEIGNPYRLENIGQMVAGSVALLAGVSLLITYRSAMGNGAAGGLKAIVVGLVLLALGLAPIGRALVQLRYFFGRGRPVDLTNLNDPQGTQPARRAAWLKECLRQNSLFYSEPQGAISGLVHYLFDTLIFAPRLIRAAAETQCFNALLTVAVLLGLLVGMVLYPDDATRAWIALVLGILLAVTLIRRFGRGDATFRRARAGIAFIIIVIAVPILGPPLIARMAGALPDIRGFHIERTLLICLAILLVAQALFFAALVTQLRPRPAINMACEQRALSLNGNPAKLFEELERLLQTRWTETIPNRLYAKTKLPDLLSGQSGSFAGEVLEETQPTPAGGLETDASVSETLRTRSMGIVAALTLLSALTFCAATLVAVSLAVSNDAFAPLMSSVFLCVILFLASFYCLMSGHLLLGRVDFDSVLMWIEFGGSFEEAQLNIGNQLGSALSSSKKVINVESMTLRVWVAELSSVILSKDGPRDLIGMRGRPDLAKFLADHLQQFAGEMTAVVAPMSTTDQARIGVIARVQQGLGGPGAATLPGMAPLAAVAAPREATAGVRRCRNPQCNAELAQTALFCSACGTAATA